MGRHTPASSGREVLRVAIGFRRPIRPGGQHQTRLGCGLGAALGVLLVAVGTRVSGESPLTGRVTDHLAVQQQRTEIPAAYAPIDYGFFAQLPTPEIRTVSDLAAVEEVEHNAVALTGYIVRVIPVPIHLAGRRATDWEFYLHLRVGPARRCEYQDDARNLVAVVTPPFQPPQTGWDLEALYDLCREQARVRLSGWLLYDYLSRTRVGRSRASAWSIHPVTQIEVWDARDRSWNLLR